tara:strand:- start:1747 stop:2001 length:255 start_codon:yes stop_codon:yes gene_type:complete
MEDVIETMQKMQYHFSMFIEEYERLPQLKNVVRRTVLEDAISVVGATMDGITHEIIDAYHQYQQEQINKWEIIELSDENENENE